ncbi:MAG: hypothetical protein WA902_14095 [Thermosynechococcaceae cyanobacterium]
MAKAERSNDSDEAVYAVEAEVVTEALSSTEVLSSTDEQRRRDQAARVRAQGVLKRYQSGFTPNLVANTPLMPLDSILASKAIIKLLYLSLAEDTHGTADEQRSAYRRAENSVNVAQSSGILLHQLGGPALLKQVIEEWIPERDQSDLRKAWQIYLA